MNFSKGYWIPDTKDDRFLKYSLVDVKWMEAYLHGAKGRRRVVQAGGNMGVYPRRLATFFEEVLTFEASPGNYECLLKNIEGMDSIKATHAALHDECGTVGIRFYRSPGEHHVDQGSKVKVPAITIDSLGLDHVDLIWLDIEGHESAALMGAQKTIKRFRPAIIVETSHPTYELALKLLESKPVLYRPELTHRHDTLWLPR